MPTVKPTNKALCAVCLVIVAILMYGFNRFTPLFCDDWHYVFIFGTQDPIRSLGDIFKSQLAHYSEFNGRYLVHCLVQLFDGILGKGVFNVANALVFALFLYGIALVTSSDKNHYYKIISIAFFFIFVLMSGFKYVFLWMSGSFNYLWVGSALLFFHYLIEKEKTASGTAIPLFMFGIVCGWSNEALAVGLGAAYFVYFMFHRDRLSRHRIWMLAGFYLGALFLVFSPASVHRAMDTAAKGISIMDRLVNMQNLRIFFVLLALIVVKLFSAKKFLEWVKREQLLILATLLTFIFILFTGFYYSHSRFGIELFSLLLILRMIPWDRVNTRLISAVNVCLLGFATYALVLSGKCYTVAQEELSHVFAGDDVIATSSPIEYSSYFRRYVLDYEGLGLKDGIDDVKYYGEDDWIPKYAGFKDKFVYFYPKIFLERLESDPEYFDGFNTLENLPFYAMRITPDQEVRYAEFRYQPSRFNSYPWPLNRIYAKFTGEVETDIAAVKVLNIRGHSYALVHKSRPDQDIRLNEILLKE